MKVSDIFLEKLMEMEGCGLVKRREWEASHFFAPSYPTDEEIINRV